MKVYCDFRERHLPKSLSLREPADFHEPIPISERLVQAIWADQLFHTQSLKTTDGKSLKVLDPGRWNVEGGPDFTDARIQIDDQTLSGDIEIHLHSTGWNEHRHASNKTYDQVILDVCLWDFGEQKPLTSQGHPIAQLILHPHLQCSLEELVESLDVDHYPFSTLRNFTRAQPFTSLSKIEILQQVESAGMYRFEQKASRVQNSLNTQGADQIAYELLSEAMGYKHNKIAFRQIAQAIPLSTLSALKSVDAKVETLLKEAERHLLRFHQVRPANHPHRRLAALALLIHLHSNPAEWFLQIGNNSKQLRTVPELQHPFWSFHYHRTGNLLKKPIALLGATRWKEIISNVILPFCHAHSKNAKESSLSEKILHHYRQLPSAQNNLVIRQIAYDLGLPPPSKTLIQQGLIQIYQDFDFISAASQDLNFAMARAR